jgi:D-alanine-D-alanine ligase
MRILLIAGGWSNERAVSLSGAKGIAAALERLGHEVLRFDPAEQFDALAEAAAGCDFAFLNLHGAPGEDGLIQAALDRVGCPYQGAGPAGSFLALHKALTKQLLRRLGLPTPDWEFLPRRPEPGWRTGLTFPIFVKSNNGGSSLDMRHARTQEELAEALDTLFAKGCEVLLETAVRGLEVTCGVLGEQALPPILIRPLKCATFFDYDSKYDQDGAEEICPAPIGEELTRRVMDLALAAHRGLGLKGYSRADFMLLDGRFLLLEVNTLPGMTPTSLIPKAAAAAGLSFDDVIARLIELGLQNA